VGRAGELFAGLIDVVVVQVYVAEGVDEITGPQAADLREHAGEQRVAGDVERHTQKHVGRALVELAAQGAVGDVELKEAVARRQGHLVDLPGVPRADQVAARVGVVFERVDHRGDLVDVAAVGRGEGPPLAAVDRAQFAVGVGPGVPDFDAVLLQVGDVGVALEKPQQLVDDRFEVQFFGGQHREAGSEVVADLPAEERAGAGAGAVALGRAVVEDVLQEVEVGPHAGSVNQPRGGAARGAGWLRSLAAETCLTLPG